MNGEASRTSSVAYGVARIGSPAPQPPAVTFRSGPCRPRLPGKLHRTGAVRLGPRASARQPFGLLGLAATRRVAQPVGLTSTYPLTPYLGCRDGTTDLSRYTTVSAPTLHPDGRRVAFETTQMDLDTDTYRRNIWLWDDHGRQYTSGDGDTAPRWSPDGSQLAFIRKGADHKDIPQVAVMPTDGGEAKVITSFPLGAKEVKWSPDGTRLLVLATSWIDEWADLNDEERTRKPRRLSAFGYRFDSRGWIHDRRSHYHLVDPAGVEDPKRIGSGEASEAGADWSASGDTIAMLTSLDDPRRMKSGVDLVEVNAGTGQQSVRAVGSGFTQAIYSPSGTLHAIGHPQPSYPVATSLWRIDSEAVDLTGHTDRSIFSFLLPPDMALPDWTDQGILIGLVDSGRVSLVRFEEGDHVATILGGDRYITGFARNDAGTIYYAASDPLNPGELFVFEGGESRQLTSFNDRFRTEASLAEPVHYRVESSAGVEVDTWLMVPEGDGPFPVLLNIHGGPASQYGFDFFDEFQVFVGAGYAVVGCNPRGSDGRGKEWLTAVKGENWGKVDLRDITAVVEDALVRDKRLDGERLGIMGGSYGGFLTAWTIGRDHRYSSAVVERALLGWESFSGTSDIARDFSKNYLGLVPPADGEALRALSPLATADAIKTPTLILHSEADFRCPIEQAEQLFMTLLRNGIDVELIRFPDESHELSRGGTPRHRVERFEYIIEWHDAHLKAPTST